MVQKLPSAQEPSPSLSNVPVDYVYFLYFHGLFWYLVLRAKNQHDLDHFDPNLRGIKIWLKIFVLRHAKPILFTKHLVVTTFQEGLIPNIHVKKSFKSSGVCLASRLTVHLDADLK